MITQKISNSVIFKIQHKLKVGKYTYNKPEDVKIKDVK